jgi:hypothetical protein
MYPPGFEVIEHANADDVAHLTVVARQVDMFNSRKSATATI